VDALVVCFRSWPHVLRVHTCPNRLCGVFVRGVNLSIRLVSSWGSSKDRKGLVADHDFLEMIGCTAVLKAGYLEKQVGFSWILMVVGSIVDWLPPNSTQFPLWLLG
jgi:hypothetical protein